VVAIAEVALRLIHLRARACGELGTTPPLYRVRCAQPTPLL